MAKVKHRNRVYKAMNKPCVISILSGKKEKEVYRMSFDSFTEAFQKAIRPDRTFEKQFVNATAERLHQKR